MPIKIGIGNNYNFVFEGINFYEILRQKAYQPLRGEKQEKIILSILEKSLRR
jgi:hypothetical protein